MTTLQWIIVTILVGIGCGTLGFFLSCCFRVNTIKLDDVDKIIEDNYLLTRENQVLKRDNDNLINWYNNKEEMKEDK